MNVHPVGLVGFLLMSAFLAALLLLSSAAWATGEAGPTAAGSGTAVPVRVQSFSPQGYVRHVRQIVVRFSGSMVALGDPRWPILSS